MNNTLNPKILAAIGVDAKVLCFARNKPLLLLMLLGFSVGEVQSQLAAIHKADKYYSNYSYSKVIHKIGHKKNLDTHSKRELAESYKMAGDYLASEHFYAEVVAAPDHLVEDVFAYAQILKMNGKYEESVKFMEQYAEMKKNDTRAAKVHKNTHYMDELLKDKGIYKIKNLDANTEEEDFGLTYFKGQMVYTSSRHNTGLPAKKWNGNNLNYLDLFIADIDTLTDELNHSKQMRELNNKYHEGPASYDKAGDIMLYTVDNYTSISSDGTKNLQLFECKLVNGEWSKPIAFPYNNKEYSIGHPALSPDGNTLYFASDMPGGKGGVDIYKSERNADGTWGTPQNLGDVVNSEGNEVFPFYHASGMLYYASDGHPGLGGLDVFSVNLKKKSLEEPENLGVPINGSKDDFGLIFNESTTRGYFASNREGGKGNDDIYSVRVIDDTKLLVGTAYDNYGNILDSTMVILYDDKHNMLSSVLTGEDGKYSFEVEKNKKYRLNGTRMDYFDGRNKANTHTKQKIITANVTLTVIPGFTLVALITDEKTGKPIEGVSLKLTTKKGEVIEYKTPGSGTYRGPISDKKLGDDLYYKVELVKKGYLPKRIDFHKLLDMPGEVKMFLSMGKPEVGADLGKLINLNPIYFDLDKYDIRPDAAIELDKIVAIMKEYPGMVIELGSHTDCRASRAYNIVLSENRARSSAFYIISKGISSDRIYGRGYGESRLANGCACEGDVESTCSEEEHQQNRRTEFIVVKMKK